MRQAPGPWVPAMGQTGPPVISGEPTEPSDNYSSLDEGTAEAAGAEIRGLPQQSTERSEKKQKKKEKES